ncbi:acyl-CoA dehydrogenase family protein [Candidatus Sumerlaeota bacterium]|nr:acyl-CoA dehydrogenase family protein [Candidatus Sumerlaeota bacterium]
MDLKYSPEDEAFRLEARQWLEKNVPSEIRDSASSRTTVPRKYRVQFYRGLRAKGWMCPKWPKEYGGPGFTLSQQVILLEEMGRVGAPNMDLGVIMAAPMIMEFGTQEQKDRYLPKMLEAEEMWAQGFSEPNAGSDLASLATTAAIDGDHFVLNGQKIWTSNGHESDWMFLLVRTDSAAKKKQEGISFLLMDMKTPGITIHPIHQITDSSNFSEVFFNNVRVPMKNLLGKLNQGWEIAKRLLTHERVGVYSGDLIRRSLESYLAYARREKINGHPMIEDIAIRRKLVQASMEIDAVCALGYRNTTRILRGDPPGPESSVIKVFASETFQRVCDVGMELQGARAQLWGDPNFDPLDVNMPKVAVYARSFSISGGTSEIQRNIIAEAVLGMPR